MAQSQATMAATKLSTIPTLAMLPIEILLLPKIIAFGGVAIGSIKAQLLAMVTGTTKINGSMPRFSATCPTTGTITTVRARLLMTSVNIKAENVKIPISTRIEKVTLPAML